MVIPMLKMNEKKEWKKRSWIGYCLDVCIDKYWFQYELKWQLEWEPKNTHWATVTTHPSMKSNVKWKQTCQIHIQNTMKESEEDDSSMGNEDCQPSGREWVAKRWT